jgi:hypothetical protein
MGLFDGLNGSYAGSDGLIDRLMASLGAPNTFQPSQTDANVTAAPAPNAPIAVGNYMMPRLGGGFAPPPDGSLPPQTSQNRAAGVLPGNAPAPQTAAPALLQSQQPAQPGFMAGYQNFRHGGGLIGSIVAGVTGQRNDPQAEVQQQQSRTLQQRYLALKAAGVPDQKAVLAAIDPEAAKTIVTEALSNRTKFGKVGQDGLGREQYGFIDENNQTVTPFKSGADDGAGGGLGNMNLTGKEYLSSLPKAQANTVQGMVEGTIPPPSSFALSKPYWQNMISAARNYDPTFDSASWSGRVAGVKDFAAGKSSEMVRSANQTLHHVGSLLDSMDALNNGNYPLLNRIENAASEGMGSGTQGSFRTNAHAVADEMAKVFKGAGISDAEIHAWESSLNENMSPAQQRAQIGKLRDLLQGSLQALEEKRLASIGPMAAEKQGPLIKDEGQRVLSRIDTWLKGAGGAAPQVNPSSVEAEMRRRGLLK